MSRGHRLYIKLGAVHCTCRGITGYTLNLVRLTVYVEGSDWCGSLYMLRGHRLYIKLGAVNCICRGVRLVRFTVYVEGSQAIH